MINVILVISEVRSQNKYRFYLLKCFFVINHHVVEGASDTWYSHIAKKRRYTNSQTSKWIRLSVLSFKNLKTEISNVEEIKHLDFTTFEPQPRDSVDTNGCSIVPHHLSIITGMLPSSSIVPNLSLADSNCLINIVGFVNEVY